jgi:hypothetical protein
MQMKSTTGMALAGIVACASLVAACRAGSGGHVVAPETGGERRGRPTRPLSRRG